MKILLYKEFMSDSPQSAPADEAGNSSEPALSAAPQAAAPEAAHTAPPVSALAHVPPSEPAPLVLESVTCPSCEAVLKNVRIEAGATLRCLNCGKRFAPVLAGSTDSSPIAAAGVALTVAAPVREPGSVGYWLLRIPAILLCSAAVLITGLSICFGHFYGRFEEIVLWSYLPLLPWTGGFLFLISRSLSRVDAGGVRAGWKCNSLKSAIPPVPGSSLPYVAPIAIAGGILPVICVRADPGSIESALIGTLIGGALFYIGFAIEDLRQFIWRQEYLARASCRDFGIDDTASRYGNGMSWSGLCLTIAALGAGCGILVMTLAELRWRSALRYTLLPFYISVAVMALSITLFRLSRDWDRAINWWQLARWAGKLQAVGEEPSEKLESNLSPWEPNWLPPPIEHDLISAVRFATWVPRLWVIAGALWLAIVMIRHAPDSELRFLGVISFSIFGAGLAFWLSFFLPQLSRWRGAQESVWMLRGQFADGGGGVRKMAFWSAIVAAAIEALLFGIMWINQLTRWGNWQFEEVAGFPLLMVLIHFPIVWFALVLHEMLDMESSFSVESGQPQ
jgi:hypothetical protein